mgnify:FL=1
MTSPYNLKRSANFVLTSTDQGTFIVNRNDYNLDPQHLAWSLENIIEGNPVNVIKVPQKEATLAKLALNKMLEVS